VRNAVRRARGGGVTPGDDEALDEAFDEAFDEALDEPLDEAGDPDESRSLMSDLLLVTCRTAQAQKRSER
jgi:hypothetical protein